MRPPQHSATIARMQVDLSDPGWSHGLPRGVIGAWTADGEPQYAYPEIAGYWLRWASSGPDLPQTTGTAVVDALAGLQLPSGLWPTRIGLGLESISPIYLQVHYLYDHAVLWDGLLRWASVRRCSRAALLADRLWEAMDCFVVDGRLSACVPARKGPGLRAQGPEPGRAAHPLHNPRANEAGWDKEEHGFTHSGWSSSSGPFLLKACARLIPGQGPLAKLCADTVAELIELTLHSPHPQAHPQLYAIEGLIELDRPQQAREAMLRLLAEHGGAEAITEHVAGGPRRSDVLAQLLRAACVLKLDDDPSWSRLAAELAARVDRQGRLPFAASDDDRPTWAGLFALQALQVWSGQPLSSKELI